MQNENDLMPFYKLILISIQLIQLEKDKLVG